MGEHDDLAWHGMGEHDDLAWHGTAWLSMMTWHGMGKDGLRQCSTASLLCQKLGLVKEADVVKSSMAVREVEQKERLYCQGSLYRSGVVCVA